MRVGRRSLGALCALGGVLAWTLPLLSVAHPGYDASIAAASEEVAAHPDDRAVRLRRVELLRRAGHYRDALADLRILARDDPHDPAMRIERALVRIAQGRARAAEPDLDAAIAAGSESVTARWARARLREADGRLAAAREDLDAAIALGGTPDLFLHRARIDTALGEFDAAAEGLSAGCEALSDPVVLRLALLEAEQRRGRPEAALAVADALLRTAPKRADWVLTRAELLHALGRDDEALAERLRALAFANVAILDRPTALHHLARARVYLALHVPAAAIADLERVAAVAPDLPDTEALMRLAKEALG